MRIGYSTGNTRGNSQKLMARKLKTYKTRPASYLCRWTNAPRAGTGGPGVSRMPLAVTIRTAVSYSSRQVGLHLIILNFIRSASWKAKQSTAGSSSARKGGFGVRFMEFTCNAFPSVLLKSLGVLLCQFLSGVTNAGEQLK